MKRLYKLLIAIAAFSWLAQSILHAEVRVPVVTDLQHDGELARTQHLPILLTFTSSICSYCDLLEEDFLQPMLLSGDYTDRVLIRKLVIDGGRTIRDFNGDPSTADKLSDRYRVFVTPTLLFVDGNGNELAERMLGINTPELFGGYLDDCIDTALERIREPDRLASAHGCTLEHAAGDSDIFRTAAP
jgi:thioredoxin-related protein